ncbi:MAG: hypothetical protein R3C19_06140 [Planctomycetaceae bacterium]
MAAETKTSESHKSAATSEEQLIQEARNAVSQCNWVVGECAARWTQRYARGRTDADFGQMVGLSGDQIFQRRRVWETFGRVYQEYNNLKWSFFYVALNWDDATACLDWADQNEATVAEMRAWRRAQHGEDLTAESQETYSEWAAPLAIDTADMPLSTVVDPANYLRSGQGDRAGLPSDPGSQVPTMSAAARESAEYAPFRSGAAAPAPGEQFAEVAVLERSEPTAEQIWKRTVSALERLNRGLTKSVLNSFDDQPPELQSRLATAWADLQEKLGDRV